MLIFQAFKGRACPGEAHKGLHGKCHGSDANKSGLYSDELATIVHKAFAATGGKWFATASVSLALLGGGAGECAAEGVRAWWTFAGRQRQ